LSRQILIGTLLEVLRKAAACRALQDFWSRDADLLRKPAIHRRKLICKCNYLWLSVLDRAVGPKISKTVFSTERVIYIGKRVRDVYIWERRITPKAAHEQKGQSGCHVD
jgi:hypothetical protein